MERKALADPAPARRLRQLARQCDQTQAMLALTRSRIEESRQLLLATRAALAKSPAPRFNIQIDPLPDCPWS